VAGVGEGGDPVILEGREKALGEEVMKTEAFNLVVRYRRNEVVFFYSAYFCCVIFTVPSVIYIKRCYVYRIFSYQYVNICSCKSVEGNFLIKNFQGSK
jgi:hypothetical protein